MPHWNPAPLAQQFLDLFAALLLLIVFAMLSQRRIVTLIRLFALQGVILALSIADSAWLTHQTHLYYSAALTLGLKGLILPGLLRRLIGRLGVVWDVDSVINIPTMMLIGIALVIFSFNLALPIAHFSHTILRNTLGIALASVLLSFMMMITRSKAVPQVIGFLAMENGLFFAATSATYGMPMVVELGVALDVLVGMFIFGIFFFQIRDTFDSLDTRQMEQKGKD